MRLLALLAAGALAVPLLLSVPAAAAGRTRHVQPQVRVATYKIHPHKPRHATKRVVQAHRHSLMRGS